MNSTRGVVELEGKDSYFTLFGAS